MRPPPGPWGPAAAGQPGSLLLDPAYLNIGSIEASTIERVLRTGTTTNLQADVYGHFLADFDSEIVHLFGAEPRHFHPNQVDANENRREEKRPIAAGFRFAD